MNRRDFLKGLAAAGLTAAAPATTLAVTEPVTPAPVTPPLPTLYHTSSRPLKISIDFDRPFNTKIFDMDRQLQMVTRLTAAYEHRVLQHIVSVRQLSVGQEVTIKLPPLLQHRVILEAVAWCAGDEWQRPSSGYKHQIIHNPVVGQLAYLTDGSILPLTVESVKRNSGEDLTRVTLSGTAQIEFFRGPLRDSAITSPLKVYFAVCRRCGTVMPVLSEHVQVTVATDSGGFRCQQRDTSEPIWCQWCNDEPYQARFSIFKSSTFNIEKYELPEHIRWLDLNAYGSAHVGLSRAPTVGIPDDIMGVGNCRTFDLAVLSAYRRSTALDDLRAMDVPFDEATQRELMRNGWKD